MHQVANRQIAEINVSAAIPKLKAIETAEVKDPKEFRLRVCLH
jgi:hypothetical protein